MLSMAPSAAALIVAVHLLLLFRAQAHHQFKFSDCGGAHSCLGPQKLERVRQRCRAGGGARRTVQELAKALDEEQDMVR